MHGGLPHVCVQTASKFGTQTLRRVKRWHRPTLHCLMHEERSLMENSCLLQLDLSQTDERRVFVFRDIKEPRRLLLRRTSTGSASV